MTNKGGGIHNKPLVTTDT